MKKIIITGFIFIILIFSGMFLLSRRDDVQEEIIKIGFVLNGKTDDRSWGQSHYNGMEKCKETYAQLEVIYRECVPEDEASVGVMEELIAEGCNIIICNSYGYGDYELEVAKRHPEIIFYHATGVRESTNLATYFGRMYQMRFLSGIVAGLQTQSGQIGYVAAFDIAEVDRGINAFTLGVRTVNPNAKVYVSWSGSWVGEEENRAATERLLSDHSAIDVLAMHMDALSPLEIADERGIWSIGYNIDNAQEYPDSFLTAPIWKWEYFYSPRISEYIKGNFVSKHYWEGVETGIVGLAPFTKNVKEGIAEEVLKWQERLAAGTYDVFYGPIRDNNGEIRVEENLSMSDDYMLNELTWFVEGVVVNE